MLLSEALKRNNNNLDFIRILSAIAVIYGHSYKLVTPGNDDPLNRMLWFTYSSALAVKIFFFISGLLIVNSLMRDGSVRNFITSRFLRIYPALFVVIVISAFVIGPLAYSGTLSDYFSNHSFLKYVYYSLTLRMQFFIDGVFLGNGDNGSINASLWTIPFEIMAYLVTLSIFILVGINNKKAITAISLVIIATPILNIDGFVFVASPASEAYLLPSCFSLGALFALHQDKINLDLKIPISFFIMFIAFKSRFSIETFFYFSICTFALYASTTDIVKSFKIKHDISYGVYLWGFPVQQLITYYFHPNLWYHIVFSVVVASLFGYLSFVFIENPAIKLSKDLKSLSRKAMNQA